ncbi:MULTISPECIES: bifunctional ornithine acetyltransferase/N-acetylglutamate synthase [unclassified Tolypothrix]|uniref:bifunctional ornithine acetyltransferase/N-acetylglutamate synthase n=1 Tax=unclassified Tolypothrix TaxID=2649714 RepID=UPI0005EABD0A|nr:MULTISPECIES: bifunctional ornithine acetyltransferase/N-acetylglutamate synthase [unclassified Tolypothrix]BAY90965.1 glutamate N-acetyltransferase [Microchaete diplosiphon NIES-3275]EKE99789.1 glutamate N-acetyltransferase/amino-acid acetyltransferase [Tolypothrix sp. PCC 7601]MBE9082487.1 bifunctional ornithine acetyltransferase/N-acetylglutamate synthase [Tolypothrix sp. LEGE 11397]UYD25075.1 bifunctional ornithine acetyltransferase/N-acetylglutamate synthase [Tolypothrix sp. PCC 7712]U
MADWQEITGGITAPRGYRAAGITAGLKPSGLPDLALIWSDVEAIAAGVFTTSQVRAACVDYCRQRLQAKQNTRAILCNAGQANAATGTQGWFDALESAMTVGQALNIPSESVLLASTGVIGQRIKMDKLKAGIPQLVAALSETGSDAAAGAIITTDLVPKSIALETTIGDRPVRIGGIAKGSGMIHPNMATMLAFVTCDAVVSPALWQQMLSRAADRSFNSITVDGDTSTNDSLIALANGQSRTPAIIEMGTEAEKLEAMLTAVCQHLAKAIARDGEGATCLMEVQVTGAHDETSARQIAKTIAGSSLVKSAIFGRDPNWGRIAAAAGRAGVPFEQENLQIKLGDFLLLENGQPLSFDRAVASAYLKQAAAGAYLKEDTVLISVSVGNGYGTGKAWGCDLSYDYVKINAEYTT